MRDPFGSQTPRPPEPISFWPKLAIAAGASLINGVLYLVPNHTQLRRARLLPWTAVDAAVPFVPATLWIYFSDYLLVATAFLLCRNWSEVRRFVRAYFALLVVGSTAHLLWPTTFPRDAFPVSGPGITVTAFQLLRRVDLPTSCLPSMHVAGSYLAAFSLWRHRPSVRAAWLVWATAIAVSTLTAKQHYLVDVVAGLGMAAAFWAVFFWRPEQRSNQQRGEAVVSNTG
jgi:membrane-associated phospholipid phosphatase